MDNTRRRHRAFGYISTPTDAGTANYDETPDAQRELISAYAQKHGLALATFFHDAVAVGSSLETREGWKGLLAQVSAGDSIVVPAFRRFTRSATEAGHVMTDLSGRRVRLHVVNAGGPIHADTPVTRVIFDFAGLEHDRISERVHQGQRRQRAKGHFAGGKVPFGYVLTPAGPVRDPRQQQALALMRKMQSAGGSLRMIAAAVEQTFGIRVSHVGVQKILSGERRIDVKPYTRVRTGSSGGSR